MAADYETLIDAQTWAFIRKTEAAYPADAVTLDLAAQRRAYDDMCAVFYNGRPDGVEVTDQRIEEVPVRIYSAGKPGVTVLYCHGGSFMLGGLDSHDDVCAEICAGTGYRVVAVDYRLAPEHTHPAAFDDAWSVLRWALETYDGPVVLTGDSAGACLVATLAHHARGRCKGIVGTVLIYPGLGGDMTGASYREHANAPLLTTAEIEQAAQAFRPANLPENAPLSAPLHDSDFSGLPPTVIFTAECDPLASDSDAYSTAIVAAGGRCRNILERGMVHGYLRARHMSDRAGASFERIVLAVEALGQKLWPYD